jgi:hypothetical protein
VWLCVRAKLKQGTSGPWPSELASRRNDWHVHACNKREVSGVGCCLFVCLFGGSAAAAAVEGEEHVAQSGTHLLYWRENVQKVRGPARRVDPR